MWWQTLYEVAMTVAPFLLALSTILSFIGKPIGFFKKKAKKAENERNYKLIEEVTQKVVAKLEPDLDEIKQQNIEQYEEIRVLNSSSKDVLRKHILDIYYKYKYTRAIPETERKMLDDFYRDYTAEHGNSYIQHRYEQMQKWRILPDD